MDIWDTIEELELRVSNPQFLALWRKFSAQSVSLLLSRLPVEASAWSHAADRFELGEISEQELTEIRVAAWHFHDSSRGSLDDSVLSGLRAVMFRLWPLKDDRWHESAWHFANFCIEAGVPEEALSTSLQDTFREVLDEH